MSQEEIQLLLKDLSARLMYGVMCQIDDGAAGLNDGKLVEIDISKELVRFDADYYWDAYIDDVKPYLRPMSSMTEEEKKQFFKLKQMSVTVIVPNVNRLEVEYIVDLEDDGDGLNHLYDWLNAHHFDYRGLIEKGLALKAPEDMYKTN